MNQLGVLRKERRSSMGEGAGRDRMRSQRSHTMWRELPLDGGREPMEVFEQRSSCVCFRSLDARPAGGGVGEECREVRTNPAWLPSGRPRREGLGGLGWLPWRQETATGHAFCRWRDRPGKLCLMTFHILKNKMDLKVRLGKSLSPPRDVFLPPEGGTFKFN